MGDDDEFLPGTPVPRTDLCIGQLVSFKSIHSGFERNREPATVIAFVLHETQTYYEFPDKVAICIKFGAEFNRTKTWARKDEIFPYTPSE